MLKYCAVQYRHPYELGLQGPSYGPQIVGVLLRGHLRYAPPIYGNSHVALL